MRATGIVRRIDDLGRVVIPKEIRRSLRIREGDPLELFVDDTTDSVVFKKYTPVVMRERANVAKVALRKEQIKFAIYDTSGIIEGSKSEDFPEFTPVNWFDNRSEFPYRGKLVFPVLANGDLFGFVAVDNSDKTEYVRAVVNMISADLSEG